MIRAIVTTAALLVASDAATAEQLSHPGIDANQTAFSARLSQIGRPPDLVHHERRGLEPGMVVVGRSGAKVGIITQIQQVQDGRPAVVLEIDGTRFRVRASQFRLARRGDRAIVALSKSQLRTAAILNAD